MSATTIRFPRPRAAFGAIALALALGPAAAAHAELFRCTGPDGKAIYTDQKSLCPGAEPHEPKGVVHPVDPVPAPAAPTLPSPGAASRREVDAGLENLWRQKKADAESVVAQIRKRRSWMKPYVAHCNRGGYVTTRDEAGIKQVVNCSVLRRDFDSLEQQEAKARDYLESGLSEECRKAGCLPGWLR